MRYLIFAIIAVMFLGGCVSERVETITIDKAHADLIAFWDKIGNIYEIFGATTTLGFVYRNQLNDFSYYTDVAPPPELTQQRCWFNCVGATRYFADFIKYKKCCDSYKMIMMKQRVFLGIVEKWHSVLVVKSSGTIFLTSNNVLSILENEEQYLQIFMAQGYNEFETTEEWHK